MPDLAFARVFCAKILFCSFLVSGTLSPMSKKKAPGSVTPILKKTKKVSVQTVLLCLFGFGLLLQFFQLFSLEKRVEMLTFGVEEGSSLNDIFGSDEEVKNDELSTMLFDFVNNLGTYEANKVRYETNLVALQAGMQENFWTASTGLFLRDSVGTDSFKGTYTDEGLEYVFSNIYDSFSPAHPVLILTLAYDGTLSIEAYGTDVKLTDQLSVDSTLVDLKNYFTNDLATLRTRIQTVDMAREAFKVFELSADFQMIVTQKGLKMLPETEQIGSYLYVFQNAEAGPVAECRILKEDASFVCATFLPEADVNGVAVDVMKTQTLELFTNVDARTVLQKKVDEQKALILGVFEDPAFKAALGNANLSLGMATETDASLQYPVLNSAGDTLRILILDKATGEVKVSLPNGQEAQSLSMAIQLLDYSSKKKLWICPVSSRTMLI